MNDMILYKFYSWNIKNTDNKNYTKESIENSHLYFNNASSFNDPFELSPVYTTQSTFSERLKFIAACYKIQEKLSTRRAKSKAHKYLIENDLIDNAIAPHLINHSYHNLRSKIGISCFTQRYENLLMWAHYADNHRGICMAFDFKDINMDLSFPKSNIPYQKIFFKAVKYNNKRLPFSLFKAPFDNNAPQFLIQKSLDWAYEEEYRAFIIDYCGLINYKPQILSSIYLGCHMSNENIEEVKSIFTNKTHRPNLYRMTLDEKEFKLNPKFIVY